MNKDTNMTYEEYKQKVKQGIITRRGNCPVTPLLLMLQGKWKNQIIYELCIKDPIRFSELKKNLSGITNTMLTTSLRELESDGLISRTQYNEIPPKVEYSLTESGKKLLPALEALYAWGREHLDFAVSSGMTGADNCGCQPRACPDSLVDSSLDGSADTSRGGSAA